MADIKISEMTTAATLNGAEVSVLSQSQSGQLVSVKATLQAIANWFAVNAEYTSALNTTDKRICGAINELKQLISLIPQFSIEVVQVLPTEDISDTTIYLAPAEDPEVGNYYEEYIHVNNSWELVGTTAVDLSGYYTKVESDGKFAVTISNTISPTTTTKKVADIKQNNVTTPVYADDADAILRQAFGEHTASGNPVSVDAFLGLEVASECKVTMNPIQDLHGYSNPWAGGEGKNRLDIGSRVNQTTADIVYTSDDNYITMNGTKKGSGYANLSSLTISLEAGTYYAKAFVISGTSTYDPYIYLFDGTANLNTSSMLGGEREITIDTAKTCTIRVGIFADEQVFTNYKIGIVISKTSGITSWSPYSNICPISGRTEASVTRTAGEDVETKTHQYSETIYGGVDDFVSGEGKNEWGHIASYNGETLPGEWISDRDVYAPNTSPTTGAEVVYKLATPTTITNTPEDISLLKGVNVLSTDGDSLELKYSADIKAYIDSKLA